MSETPYMTKREFMEVYRVKHTRFWSEVRKGRIKVLHPTPRCILIKRADAETWAMGVEQEEGRAA